MNSFIFHVLADFSGIGDESWDVTREFIGTVKAKDGADANEKIKTWCRDQNFRFGFLIKLFGVTSQTFQINEVT